MWIEFLGSSFTPTGHALVERVVIGLRDGRCTPFVVDAGRALADALTQRTVRLRACPRPPGRVREAHHRNYGGQHP